ncbi:hypothetical protein [Dactylosporangium sp. CA-233914]|uniref:hypothetical protein n=1 Tax=Dactylosporangium sp. CA-233914 TaxID=3239934 RepID=UPI003D8C9F8C
MSSFTISFYPAQMHVTRSFRHALTTCRRASRRSDAISAWRSGVMAWNSLRSGRGFAHAHGQVVSSVPR